MMAADRADEPPERPGIVHIHLVASSMEARSAIAPIIASRYGSFSCHGSVEEFQVSVCTDDWGVVLVELPDGELVSKAELVRQTHPCFRLILTAREPSVETVIHALRTGVSDFFELPAPAPALFDALMRALREAWSSHVVRQQSVEAARRLSALTRRESDVLQLLVNGETSKQIARQLGLRHRTVEYFRARLFAKTGVDSVADLMRMHAVARVRPDFHVSTAYTG